MATALLPRTVAEAPAEPFHLSAAWARCWGEAYPEGRPLTFNLGGGAHLRMTQQRSRLGPLRVSLLASPTNLQTCYFDLGGDVPAPEALDMLPTRLLQTGAAQVRIDWLLEDSQLLAAASAWSQRHLALIQPFALSPLADCRGDFEAYLARGGSSVAKYWKSCRRHILNGPLNFSIVTSGVELEALLDEMFALEAAGWKGQEGSAILSVPADAIFYRSLALAAAEAGALRIAVLREEGRLIAFEYCVVGGSTVFAMKVGYDENRRRLQPGHLAALMNIRDACADPELEWYDMLGNSMRLAAYKQRFATDYRTVSRIRLFARTPLGMCLYALYRAKPFAKRLRSLVRRRSSEAPRLQNAGTGSLQANTKGRTRGSTKPVR
jgi:CelD/BcsL family acetyltransferase involved in cellulose biosynthesis